MADRHRMPESMASRNLAHLDALTLAVCHLRDRTYSRRRFLDEAARLADWYNIDRINERRAAAKATADAADRPRLASPEHAATYPLRLVVIRDANPEGWPEWTVYLGTQDISTHATHAEAITAATELARQH